MVGLKDPRLRTKCMLPMCCTFKSTHLYSVAGNLLIWQVSTPCRPPASLLGALFWACRETLPGRGREPHVHRPPRPIASIGYPEAGESLIRRIAQRQLLVGLHNKYLNQLLRGV